MQTWFITGASGGLASRITRRLLERGDRVAVTVRKPGVLDDLKAQYGSRLWQAHLDLTNPQQIVEVIERAWEELGTIDVLVNNAAYGLYGAVEEASDGQIEHLFMTNVLGSLRAARAVLPFFPQTGQRAHRADIEHGGALFHAGNGAVLFFQMGGRGRL